MTLIPINSGVTLSSNNKQQQTYMMNKKHKRESLSECSNQCCQDCGLKSCLPKLSRVSEPASIELMDDTNLQNLEILLNSYRQFVLDKISSKGFICGSFERTGNECYANNGKQSQHSRPLFECLTNNARHLALSLLPLSAETAKASSTNLATCTGGRNSNTTLTTHSWSLPRQLSLGQCKLPTKMAFGTIFHWTLMLTSIFLFFVCLNNRLIASVSASQHSRGNPRSIQHEHHHRPIQLSIEQQQQQLKQTNKMNDHHSYYYYHYYRPAMQSQANVSPGSKTRLLQNQKPSSNLVKFMSSERLEGGTKTLSKRSHLSGKINAHDEGDDFTKFDGTTINPSVSDQFGQRLNQAKQANQSADGKQPLRKHKASKEQNNNINNNSNHSNESLPELSFRQSVPTISSSPAGQWIPIVSSSNDMASPLLLQSSRLTSSTMPDYPVSSRLDGHARAAGYGASQTRQENRTRSRPGANQSQLGNEPLQQQAANRHYQQHQPGWFEHHHRHQQHIHGRQRRPRLNDHYNGFTESNEIVPMSPSKVYTRVLLCEKTLVSLDYVRARPLTTTTPAYTQTNAAIFADPSSSSSPPSDDSIIDEVLNDIGDNLIDLDGHYNTLASSYAEAPQRNPAESNSTSGSSRFVNQSTSTTASTRNAKLATRAADQLLDPVQKQHQPSSISSPSNASFSSQPLMATSSHNVLLERRSRTPMLYHLLNEEDALIRCDMWDLEKGLKSRKPPEHLVRVAIKTDFDTVREAINKCRQLSEKTLPPEDEYRDGLELMSSEDLISLFSVKRGLIPGTKWCGLGDQANSYNDLGPKHRIDICCRAHDHCPIRSKPFRNDYGVLNIGLYTKSHCDCDADFYRCLREVHSRAADMLGNLYFNVMKLQCMREERLKVCREMKPIALGFERCIRYEDSPIKTVFKFTTPPVAY